MKLNDTVIIAAQTARTNAYAQALKHAGISLKGAVVFGEPNTKKAGQAAYVPENTWPDAPVFMPDLSQSLDESLAKVTERVVAVQAAHVNDPPVLEALADFDAELIIYSGYGSQIVGESLLDMGAPLLHLHAGWLPEFRGSTTTYYHLLATGDCGVSAIFLEKEIDTGPILARKRYPRPPAQLDIDYLYDGAIRADLLVDVLAGYGRNGALPHVATQTPTDGNNYYVIHPVLKHLALLSLDGAVSMG